MSFRLSHKRKGVEIDHPIEFRKKLLRVILQEQPIASNIILLKEFLMLQCMAIADVVKKEEVNLSYFMNKEETRSLYTRLCAKFNVSSSSSFFNRVFKMELMPTRIVLQTILFLLEGYLLQNGCFPLSFNKIVTLIEEEKTEYKKDQIQLFLYCLLKTTKIVGKKGFRFHRSSLWIKIHSEKCQQFFSSLLKDWQLWCKGELKIMEERF